MQFQQEHAEKVVKKWFDDLPLDEIPEDAAENGNGDRRRSCRDAG